MAVAARLGGANPDFTKLYGEVTRISKNLSIASPRAINDPGETLKITINDTETATGKTTTQEFDIYMKAFYGKEGDQVNYELYYKDANNKERRLTQMAIDPITKSLTDQRFILNDTPPVGFTRAYRINGQAVAVNQQLVVDSEKGEILFNGTAAVGTNYNPTAVATNKTIGIVKLDGATGLDVGLINDRISQVNLTIEALNKVILVASGNVETAVNLRL